MSAIIIIIVVGAVIALFSKIGAKGNMENKLGRQVEEHELVSLNSWMEAKPEAGETKNINPVPAKSSTKIQIKPTFKEKVAVLEDDYEKESKKLADNCPACGAALSKSLPYCGFCGQHASRKALETHCALFLVDLEKEFDDRLPARHAAMRLGCVWTILGGVGIAGIGILLTNSKDGFTILACAAANSAMIGYLFTYIAEKSLDRKEAVIFQQWITPKIRQFMRKNNLKQVEFLGIAEKHSNGNSSFVKYLFRQF